MTRGTSPVVDGPRDALAGTSSLTTIRWELFADVLGAGETTHET